MDKVTVSESFWSNVQKGDECWEWQGSKHPAKGGAPTGYGYLSVDGVRHSAHRLAYRLANGEIADDLVIDHLCRNPACVNPAHLEAVTNVENVLRGDSPPARNRRKTHCKRGHELSGGNVRYYSGRRHCLKCRQILSAEYITRPGARERATRLQREKRAQRRREK